MIRGYSKDHAIEMGYPLPDYRFPEQPGECDATLTLKVWGGERPALLLRYQCWGKASPLRMVQHRQQPLLQAARMRSGHVLR